MGELVQIERPEDDRPRLPQTGDAGRIPPGGGGRHDLRATSTRHTGHEKQILDRQRAREAASRLWDQGL